MDGTVIRESSPEATLLSWGTLKVHCGLAQVGWGEIRGLGQGDLNQSWLNKHFVLIDSWRRAVQLIIHQAKCGKEEGGGLALSEVSRTPRVFSTAQRRGPPAGVKSQNMSWFLGSQGWGKSHTVTPKALASQKAEQVHIHEGPAGAAPTMASSCSEWGGRGGFWPTVTQRRGF